MEPDLWPNVIVPIIFCDDSQLIQKSFIGERLESLVQAPLDHYSFDTFAKSTTFATLFAYSLLCCVVCLS
jgi:hypothetical protein